ncbi:mannosylglucosyl-3-phosphoglycerate phosphatase isoform X1 [Drosophila subobscura]|uniref:mannosylglucosyl-3-phosphoglycerate phosphatase isoform X1 n=3 Tax=Drosophila subobscura TaxID=7241 RepID=UPI00155AD39F|nr:mannosylglucosyl-3-phosphoglycerate phosphatase isoform X1 [Drosophila subobscura]
MRLRSVKYFQGFLVCRMSTAGTDGAGGGDGAPPTTPSPSGHGPSRRHSHLSGSNRSGGAATMGNVVGWLKQASIEVRDAGTRTLSMLQSSNPNFRSLDLSLATPTATVPTSTSVPAATSSAAASLCGSTNFGNEEDPSGSLSLTPQDARELLTHPTRAYVYASVSQPQSPRHRGSSTRTAPHGLNGRSTSISSQLEKTKKLLKMTEGEDKPLTILHYNDVYNIESMAETEPVGGAARFATAIKGYAHLNPLVLFSGDAFSPSMLSTFTQGEQMVPVLNSVGTHCAVFGNHDFDHGLDVLVQLIKKTEFPWLMSNVVDNETGRPLGGGKISHFILHNQISIGLIGLVEREWLETLPTIDPNEVTYIDYVEAGNRLARELRNEGCDLIIALTHMRTPNDINLAENCNGIDIILGGHDHVREVTEINGKMIVKSGTDFQQFSVITIERDAANREHFTTDVKCVDVTAKIPEDPELKEELSKYAKFIESKLSDVMGVFSVELDGRFSRVRTQETNLGNWVCDVVLAAVGADVVILNGGTFRSDRIHPVGAFTMGDLVNVIPMRDPLILLEVSGRVLWQALENGVSAYPKLEGRFPQVAGISFAFNPLAEPGKRIDPQLIQVGDEYLNLEQTYKLCVKSYIFMGCDGYTMFKGVTVLMDDDACPELGITLQNHFKAINSRKCGQNTKHRQSLVTLSRRHSLVQCLDSMDLDGPSPIRKLSVGHHNKSMDLSHGNSQKMLRRASLDDLEQSSCELAPQLEHRIVMIQNEEHHRQLLYKKETQIMNSTITEAEDDYKSRQFDFKPGPEVERNI